MYFCEHLLTLITRMSAFTRRSWTPHDSPPHPQIVYMGWVDEKEQDSVQDRMYSPKFLALRGSSLFKFTAPPVSGPPLSSSSDPAPNKPAIGSTAEQFSTWDFLFFLAGLPTGVAFGKTKGSITVLLIDEDH